MLVAILQSEVAALRMMGGSATTGQVAGGLTATLDTLTLGTTTSGVDGIALPSAAASGATDAAGPANPGPDAAASMGGSFFESLTSSDFYKNTKVWFVLIDWNRDLYFLDVSLSLSLYQSGALYRLETSLDHSAGLHFWPWRSLIHF